VNSYSIADFVSAFFYIIYSVQFFSSFSMRTKPNEIIRVIQ
jgi:hypothetical protein